jgi:hypothetical protein
MMSKDEWVHGLDAYSHLLIRTRRPKTARRWRLLRMAYMGYTHARLVMDFYGGPTRDSLLPTRLWWDSSYPQLRRFFVLEMPK